MAQHDYNLINQTGASFRADLNNALSAIATNNAGASSPSTTFAYEWWIDESNGVLKIRNSANSAWITTGINLTTNNLFTGDITGNAPTATILANTRTINGVAFNGSANISFNSDSVSEGSSNLYFTNERTDDRVNDLLVAGSGISLTYSDANNTLTIANTNDADITSVVAGNALSGGGTSGAVTLNVAVDDSSIEIDSDALRVKASGITNTMLAGSIANNKLANSSVTINSQSLSLGSSLTLNTNNIGEGISNLYYTDARFDTRLATKDTDNLGEGTNNLYYTNERVDDRVATLIQNGTGISFTYDDTNATLTPVITLSPFDTSNLSESGNLYYTDARARASISENSAQLSYNSGTGVLTYTQGDTDTVAEGANLYYTDARANSAIDARVTNTFINNLSGVVADTTTALATARSIALSGDVVGTVSFDGTSDVTISSTIQANSVALSTDTTGDYVQTITGTNNKITVSGSGTEGRDVTLTLPSDVQIANDLTVAGNLTVNGTLTSLDTTNLDIEDNLFQLNAGLTGSPVNDSGMLINRGNQNNGIFMWDESVDKFTMGLTTADGSSTGNITLASLGTLVVNVEGALTGNVTGQVSDISNFTTANLSENTNLYYTQARFDTAFGNKSTTNLSEGTNLYYTDARVQAVSINNVVEDTTPQLGGNLATNSNDILFADNDKAIFGAGSDLQIYHDGSNSYIDDSGTGGLIVRADNFYLRKANDVENMIIGSADGAVTLYHDNASKLATTSAGIDVTGTVVSDSLTVDTTTLVVDASNNRVGIATTSPTGKIHVKSGSTPSIAQLIIGYNDTSINYFDANTHIFRNGSSQEKMRLTSAGKLGLGTISPDAPLTVHSSSDPEIRLGYSSSQDHRIAWDSAKLFIDADPDNGVGNSALGFRVDGSEAARFDDSGRLLVGTTSHFGTASAKLQAQGDGIAAAVFNRTNDGNVVTFKRASGTGDVGSIAIVDSGNKIGFYGSAGSGIVVDGSGNCGIGTSSPSDELTIRSTQFATTTLSIGDNSDRFRIGYLHASGLTGGLAAAQLGSDAYSDLSIAAPSNAASEIKFFTNASSGTPQQRATIDSSGNLLHGTTGTSWTNTAGTYLFYQSALNVTRDGAESMNLNRLTSDGDILTFRKDGSTVGSIGAYFGAMYIGTPSGTDGHIRLGQAELVPATSTGANRDNYMDLGASSARFKDLYLSGTATATNMQVSNGGKYIFGGENTRITGEIDGNGKIRMFTGGTEKVILDGSNVGIGTSSPIAKQHNLITSNGTALLLNNSAGGSNAYVDLDFNTYSVTVAGYANAAATIRVIDDGNYSGDITFRTKANAVDGSQTERMRIKSDGDLYWHQQPSSSASGISFSNTTHPSITVSGGSDTQFRHRMVFINGNGTVGLITTSGSATAYNTSSDYRLKENVDYDFNALDRVAQLKPARFNFIADADTTVDGFLAHEVQDIVPEAITGEKDAVDDEGNPDYQGIDQSKLVPLLTKAIQEQQDQIDKLSKEIVKLKKK